VLRGGSREIHCLAFRNDGKRLAAGGEDRVIHLWEPETGAVVSGTSPGGAARTLVALSPDGTRLAATGQGNVLRVWEAGRVQAVASGILVGRELPHPGPVGAVAWSPDGRWLAAGTEDGLIRLWDAATGDSPRLLDGQDQPVTCLTFSPDSKMLASAGATDLAVWLWDVGSGEPILLIPDALDGCAVHSVAFLPNGRVLAVGGIDWLATGGSDGAVCLWDLEDRCEVATFRGGVTGLAVHPSGRWLAATTLVPSVCLLDLSAGELVNEVNGPEETLAAIAFSPDGRWLAAGGDDRLLRLWRLGRGPAVFEERAAVPLDTHVQGLCFSPDSRFLFTGNGNTTCYRLEVRQLVSPSV
jgi:WD40 repeat protein